MKHQGSRRLNRRFSSNDTRRSYGKASQRRLDRVIAWSGGVIVVCLLLVLLVQR